MIDKLIDKNPKADLIVKHEICNSEERSPNHLEFSLLKGIRLFLCGTMQVFVAYLVVLVS